MLSDEGLTYLVFLVGVIRLKEMRFVVFQFVGGGAEVGMWEEEGFRLEDRCF
jgi:hypothetical protein